MELRDYQGDTIEGVRQSIRAGHRRIIIQAPCGSGKTIMAASIIKGDPKKNKKVVFLVHLRQLAYQAMERFKAFGMDGKIGMIMAGEKLHLDRPVQIISIQTYIKRLDKENIDKSRLFIDADIAMYDECLAKGTEILTEDGWLKIESLKEEKVAQYNQDNRQVSFTAPSRKIEKYHDGELINFYGKQGIDLTATPGHEQPYFILKSNKPKKQTFGDWKASDHHCIPIAGYATGDRKLTFEDRFKIMAAADGNIAPSGSIRFGFSKQRKIDRFLWIVEKCGYKLTESKKNQLRVMQKQFAVFVCGSRKISLKI